MSNQSITLLTDHQSFLTESIDIILLRKKCERRKEEWKKERRVEEGKKSGRRKEERVKRERKWSEAERWSVRESRVRGIERKKVEYGRCLLIYNS